MKRLKAVLVGMVSTVALAAVFAMPAVTQAVVYSNTICPVQQSASYTVNYDGVSINSDLCKAMQYLTSRNVMTQFGGYYQNSNPYIYGVNSPMGAGYTNRAQAAAVVLNAFDTGYRVDINNPPYGSQLGFIDTPSYEKQWWYGYVLRAKQLGFITGYNDGSIRGGNNVSRAEFIKMFLAASPHKYDFYNDNGLTPYFSDVPANEWYAQYVAYVASYGNMIKAFKNSRCYGDNFCPNLPITQTESALFMYYYSQLFGNIGTGTTPVPMPNPGVLATPYLSSPANGANYYYSNFNGGKNNLQLNWGVTSGATKYDLMVNFYVTGQYATNYNKTYTTTTTGYAIPAGDLPNMGTWGTDKISWKVRAYDIYGNYKDSSQWYVNDNYGVQPNPPVMNQAPTITSPAANAVLTNYPRQAYLAWTAVTMVSFPTVKYQVELGCDICNGGVNYSNPVTYESTSTYMYQTMTGDNTFRFRVRSVDAYGTTGPWSDYRYFSYLTASQSLTRPVLSDPADGYQLLGTSCDQQSVFFQWSSVSGATKYYLTVGGYAYGPYYGTNASINLDSYANGTYNWSVTAYDANNNITSFSRTIYIQQSACVVLTKPTLVSPNDNLTYYAGNQATTFSWNSVPGATKYDLMLYFDGYSNPTIYTVSATQVTLQANQFPFASKVPYFTHFWKVRAYDANGNYLDSATRYMYVYPQPT